MEDITKKRTKIELPNYLKMYEISGQDSVTHHGFARYNSDRQQDKAIESHVSLNDKIKTADATGRRDEVFSMIKFGLENGDTDTKVSLARMIKYAYKEERGSLIRMCLIDKDIRVQKEGVVMIGEAAREEAPALIELGLKNPNPEVQKKAAGMISSQVPWKDAPSLIRLSLQNSDVGIWRAALDALEVISLEEGDAISKMVLEEVEKGLKSSNVEKQKFAAAIVEWVPIDKKDILSGMVVDKIREHLKNSDIHSKKVAVSMIEFVPISQKSHLVKLALENPEVEVQREAVKMLEFIPWREANKLTKVIIQRGLGEELIKPKLYESEIVNQDTFSRKKFDKTGSEITLVGGNLKGKVIVRHIESRSFLAWKKIYENYSAWQKAGFDYVPIEPIVSYKFNPENGLVDVFSSVLDLSLASWQHKSNLFERELESQMKKIVKVLDKLEITHGHMHRYNFCLRFFRDNHGKVDFTRVPRLYLIDFDQAVSPEK